MKHYLNLGAGVQSSCLALMAARGKVTPMPEAAIFADTQAEPASVYAWLDKLEKMLPFPVVRVTAGSLEAVSLTKRRYVRDPTRAGHWSKSLIPAFILGPDGKKGIMARGCTVDYKVSPLTKAVRQLAQVRRGEKRVVVTQWLGISYDEVERMKPSREPWAQFRYPLIDLEMTRADCLRWMQDHGYPRPPRSACRFCPFHSNAEWRRLRDEEPDEFRRAVEFERALQRIKTETDHLRGVPYLHSSCVPLDQADLRTDIEKGQTIFDFRSECEGMCGV